MDTPRAASVSTTRIHIAQIERRVGWLAAGLGALALVSFRVLGGNEHRLVALLLLGVPALLGGCTLIVAGRVLARPGRAALAGQLLPLLFATYWVLLLNG